MWIHNTTSRGKGNNPNTELSEKGRKGELYTALLNKSFGLRRFDLEGNKILLGKDCSNI